MQPEEKRVSFNLTPSFVRIPSRGCADYYDPCTERASFRLPATQAVGAPAVPKAKRKRKQSDREGSRELEDTAELDEPAPAADRWWLVDTGCPYDLTSIDNPANIMNPIPAEEPIDLDTANNEVRGDVQVPIQMQFLANGRTVPEDIAPYGLAETPDVLGVGFRVEERDFAFYWDRTNGATFYLPGGIISPPVAKKSHEVKLQICQGVPYFGQGTGCFQSRWHRLWTARRRR